MHESSPFLQSFFAKYRSTVKKERFACTRATKNDNDDDEEEDEEDEKEEEEEEEEEDEDEE